MLRWNYINATWDWWWEVDSVEVTACEPVALQPICQTPQLTIPDNDPTGASTTLTVPSGGSLSDLDFSTNTTHTWVGDLKYTLQHVDTGTTVTLIDQPGVPATTFGCSGDNINATINDEGADGNVETTCLAATPTIAGDLVGGDPANTSLLAAFDGESFAGDWTLTVSDNAGGDTGIVNEWCLIPGGGAGGDPNIDVSPLSLASTQATNTTTNQPLTIANTGGGTLNWTIAEENLPGPDLILPTQSSAYDGSANVAAKQAAQQPASQPVTIGDNVLAAAATGAGQTVTPSRPATPDGLVTITHSLSQAITAGNSVSCNAGGLHTDNSYMRVFDLATFGLPNG